MGDLRDELLSAFEGEDEELENKEGEDEELENKEEGEEGDLENKEEGEEGDLENKEEGEEGDLENKEEGTKEKPPVCWSPKNREHWGALPSEVKEQINKREREVNDVLQKSSYARRVEQAFTQTIEPYRAILNAEGIDNPLVAIDELMKTASALSMGNPQQKAMRIAGLISHYGVDIGVLDAALAGENVGGENSADDQISSAVNKALAPFIQQQEEQTRRQNQDTYSQVSDSIGVISKKEFYNDVRLDMADIMELSSKRGQVITLEQAYEKAVSLNPELSSIIATRDKSKNISNKRRAASSIHGNKSGINDNTGAKSTRELLSDAWDNI